MGQQYYWYQKGNELKKDVETTYINNGFAYWYIGQVGMIFKWKEQIIYIDPVLNDLYGADGNSRRNYPPPFSPDNAAKPDIIMCTHNHADHMNVNTLVPMLNHFPDAKLIVPAPEAEGLIKSGVEKNRIIPAVQETVIQLKSDISICPVAAAHPEYCEDEYGAQYALSYLVRLGEKTIFHSGDTYLTKELLERLQQESVALACLSINGRDYERESRGIIGNMSYRDAGYLAGMIEADMTIPMHYDMVQGNEENPLRLLEYMEERWPGRKCHIMKLGEKIIYNF